MYRMESDHQKYRARAGAVVVLDVEQVDTQYPNLQPYNQGNALKGTSQNYMEKPTNWLVTSQRIYQTHCKLCCH